MSDLAAAFLGVALLLVGYLFFWMIDKLDHIQNLVELYGENTWKHFREEEQRRYFEEREEE